MSDLISKNQSLVEWKENFKGFVECLDMPRDDYNGIMAYIDEVPSAEKTQLSEEDATSVCKCPCEYREPCDVCHYDDYREHGCPAEEGLKDERNNCEVSL